MEIQLQMLQKHVKLIYFRNIIRIYWGVRNVYMLRPPSFCWLCKQDYMSLFKKLSQKAILRIPQQYIIYELPRFHKYGKNTPENPSSFGRNSLGYFAFMDLGLGRNCRLLCFRVSNRGWKRPVGTRFYVVKSSVLYLMRPLLPERGCYLTKQTVSGDSRTGGFRVLPGWKMCGFACAKSICSGVGGASKRREFW